MTVLVRGANSYFMGARAFLLDEDKETASDWANEHITYNPAIKWVLGRYAEADNPNSNRQAWSLEDLRLARSSVNHAPMNLLHQPKNIVGAFTASEMIYPTDAASEDGEPANPYIETLGAFWRYYFPNELAVVQAAHDEGSLFFSMECVADTVTFKLDGAEETFPYKGPQDASYGDWNGQPAERWLNKPHFIGGALIIPPARPGWNKAEIKSIAQYVETHAEMAEQIYTDVADQAPHLDGDAVERITNELLTKGMTDEELGETSKNSIYFSDMSNNEEDTKGRSQVNQGGDNMSETHTYSEKELQAAIAEAVAPLKAELDELKNQADVEAADARIVELQAAFDAEVSGLKAELDAKTAEVEAAKADRDAVVEWLEAEAKASADAAERAERMESRSAKVAEVANFSAEYIEENKERWADMDEASFDALVTNVEAAIAAVSTKEEETSTEVTTSTETAMNNERETAGAADKWADFRDLGRASVHGTDFSTL